MSRGILNKLLEGVFKIKGPSPHLAFRRHEDLTLY